MTRKCHVDDEQQPSQKLLYTHFDIDTIDLVALPVLPLRVMIEFVVMA
jgi:hypothetical protein